MTTFALVSDLHLEGWTKFSCIADIAEHISSRACTDVLVIAGDSVSFGMHLHLLEAMLEKLAHKYKQVLMVLGNHEHWAISQVELQHKLLELQSKFSRFMVLSGQHITIGGIRITGHTLWHKPVHDLRLAINDTHYIEDYFCFIEQQYANARAWLGSLEQMQPHIVVSHHLPDMQLVPTRFMASKTNSFFVHEGASQFAGNAKYWLYGHTHQACNVQIGVTQFVANPVGYISERFSFDSFAPYVFEVKA